MSESKESVFRFVTIRSPKSNKSKKSKKRAFLYAKETSSSEFFKLIEKARKENASKEEVIAIAAKFKDSSSYICNINELEFDIKPLANWIGANHNKPLRDLDIEKEIKKIYTRDPNELINSAEFKKSFSILADTILCDCIKRGGAKRVSDMIIGTFRLMSLLKEFSTDESLLTSDVRIGEIVKSYRLILPEFANLSEIPFEKKEVVKKDEKQKKSDDKEKKRENLKELLEKLEMAHREFSRIATDDSYRLQPSVDKAKSGPKIASLEKKVLELTLAHKQLDDRIKSTEKEIEPKRVQSGSLDTVTSIEEREFILSPKAFEGLREESKDVLKYFRIDSKKISPEKVLSLIENEMNHIDSQLVSEFSHPRMIAFHGVTLDEKKFRESFMGGLEDAAIEDVEDLLEHLPSRCKFQAGVGDLLVVKQKLKAYELADFAHVENVLTGEIRDRTHRRLNIREEYREFETEEEITKERDLQSTERNEMQVEAEKIVRSQFELDAGMQISGSYGPVISFSASLDDQRQLFFPVTTIKIPVFIFL